MNMDARTKEHLHSQDNDIARKSSRPKVHSNPIHPSMAERTNTSIGAPPRDNNPPDASSALPTDPTKQHGSRQFLIPGITRGMSSHSDRGRYDPQVAFDVMGEAKRDVTDYAKDLHAVLPQAVTEN
jgi:hypothetical protein